MNPDFNDIGQSLMDDIIKADLLHAESEGVIVWSANSPEVLEAIAGKYCHELHRRILSNLPHPDL